MMVIQLGDWSGATALKVESYEPRSLRFYSGVDEVFWDMTLCRLVNSLAPPKRRRLEIYTASYSRRHEHSFSETLHRDVEGCMRAVVKTVMNVRVP
jgi:hypothetical protein